MVDFRNKLLAKIMVGCIYLILLEIVNNLCFKHKARVVLKQLKQFMHSAVNCVASRETKSRCAFEQTVQPSHMCLRVQYTGPHRIGGNQKR